MRTIANQWSNLANGYQELVRLQDDLRQEWEKPLENARQLRLQKEREDWEEKKRKLDAENQQYQKRYDRELNQWRLQLESYTKTLEEWKLLQNELSREKSKLTLYLIFGGLLAIMLIFSVLGIPLSLIPIYFMIQQYRKVERLRTQLPPQPRPPKKPQPFDYEARLGKRPTMQTTPTVSLDIIAPWWKALGIQEQPERGYGLEGVSNLLDELTNKLPDNFLTFQELLVTQSLDADVLVLGPNGIWVLESKFWAGQVVCQKGTWYQVKDVYQRGGTVDKKVTSYGINPDDQWLREQSMVIETLRRRVPNHPFLLKIVKGGLVFTHPEVELLIDNSCKVQWGKVAQWAETILRAKPVRQFTSEIQLEVADAILTFANIVDNASPQRSSAASLAERIYQTTAGEAKKYIMKWEKASNQPRRSDRRNPPVPKPAVSKKPVNAARPRATVNKQKIASPLKKGDSNPNR
jgi:hypothetical protein